MLWTKIFTLSLKKLLELSSGRPARIIRLQCANHHHQCANHPARIIRKACANHTLRESSGTLVYSPVTLTISCTLSDTSSIKTHVIVIHHSRSPRVRKPSRRFRSHCDNTNCFRQCCQLLGRENTICYRHEANSKIKQRKPVNTHRKPGTIYSNERALVWKPTYCFISVNYNSNFDYFLDISDNSSTKTHVIIIHHSRSPKVIRVGSSW